MAESCKQLFQGRIISLDIEQVTLPNGVEIEMEIVRHPGGAAVVAIDEKQNTCLLKQYRYACDSWVWELPAGKIDNNEEPLLTAQRELQEEAGRTAAEWQSLGHMISSPGVFTEVVHCYLATELAICDTQHEPEELIEIHWIPFKQAHEWAIENLINDAKTVIGLCRANAFLTRQ
jgi:8-oxo-dGTP pyrophosphatase MutT (NUDIX family)